MEILNLTLTNFRNFAHKNVEFDPKLSVIVGKNGSGKSNVLEAVGLLSGIRSARVETDLDLVRFGKSETKVQGKVAGDEENTLTINFQVVDERLVRKAYFVNSFKKRLADFIGLFSIVIFAPLDLDLVSGSPSLRRHHLDMRLSSVDREYWRNISAYNKIVVRRNKILQAIGEGKSRPLELNFWDERLAEHGKFISKAREEFFEFLNFVSVAGPAGVARGPVGSSSRSTSSPALSRLLTSPESRSESRKSGVRALSGTPSAAVTPRTSRSDSELRAIDGFSWELKQSLVSTEKLLKNRERDIAAGVTLSGPHRDDFRFIFREKDLEFFGSRGEQRMAVLALKLAELEYYRVKRGVRPILALDDIFSELDWEHRKEILSIVGSQQTIVTAAESDSVPKEILKKAKVINL